METSPAISIILPLYNGEAFVQQTIESILNQSFEYFELIIINDASTDKSKEIVLSFQDKRIRYIENESNMGISKTLNRGIDLCCGKYIARIDADDVCMPDRLKTQWEFLEKNPAIGLCGSWAIVIDENNKAIGKIINQTDPKFISIALLFSVPLIHPSVCCKTSILKQYKYADIPLIEDYDIWCRMSKTTQMANIPKFLLKYRWHTNNISKGKNFVLRSDKIAVKQQIAKLGLFPDDEAFRIHQLSFNLSTLNNSSGILSETDLYASDAWFSQLLSANKRKKIYDQEAFTAFLWGRWIVLCIQCKQKRKIFTPSFASWHPKTLYYVWKQIRLLSRKI